MKFFDMAGSPMDGGQPGPKGDRFGAIKEALGLEDYQIEEIMALRRQLREEMKPVVEEQRQLQQQLRDSAGNAEVSDAERGALVSALEKNREQIRVASEANKEAVIAKVKAWGLGDKLAELQAAAELQRAVGEGAMLGLIEGPPRGRGAMGRMGMRGGPGGPGGMQPMRGPGGK